MITRVASVIRPKGSDVIFDDPYTLSELASAGSPMPDTPQSAADARVNRAPPRLARQVYSTP
jgi:hypothetical protein